MLSFGYRPPVEEEKEEETPSFGETFKRYEVDLEINDFPQTARWRVTSRVSDAVAWCCCSVFFCDFFLEIRGATFQIQCSTMLHSNLC